MTCLSDEKTAGAANEASHHSTSPGVGREGFPFTSHPSLHFAINAFPGLSPPGKQAIRCRPRVPWMNDKYYPVLYCWIISDCSCMLSLQSFQTGKQARTLQPLRLSCREKVLPTDCVLSETVLVQGANKRKMKGWGLLFLLLPSDCCTWFPAATWEAVSYRAARTHDHWPTEMVQQNGCVWQCCVLCSALGAWGAMSRQGSSRRGMQEMVVETTGRLALSPPAGYTHPFLQHTHTQGPCCREAPGLLQHHHCRREPRRHFCSCGNGPPMRNNLLHWHPVLHAHRCPSACVHGPPWKYRAAHPPWCCVGRAVPPGACRQMGHSPPQPHVLSALLGVLGRHAALLVWEALLEHPRVLQVPRVGHSRAGTLAFWLYFTENVWGCKKLLSAFKCTVACGDL